MLGLVATICSANAEWTEVDVNDIDSNVLILLQQEVFQLTEGASELELDSIKVEIAVKAGIFYKFTLQSGDLVINVVIQKRLDGTLRAVSTNVGARMSPSNAEQASTRDRKRQRAAPAEEQESARNIPSLVNSQNGKA